MQTSHIARLRLGALTLGLAALLFFAGLTHPHQGDTPTVVAQTVSSTYWIVGHLLLIISHILLPAGLLALYAIFAGSRSERLAFVGWVFSLIGAGMSLPLFGVLAFALPVPGQQGAGDMALTILNGPAFAIFLGGGTLLLAVGAILFSIAIWRSGMLSRVAAALYTAGLVALLAEPVLGQIGDSIAGGVLALGGLWLAWGLWQRVSAARHAPVMDTGVKAVNA